MVRSPNHDRRGAKVIQSITGCQLSELEILKKFNTLLLRHPDITSGSSSEIEVADARLEAMTTGLSDVKRNTVTSIPLAFGGKIFPPAYPANVVMSVISRDCKKVRKSDTRPELCSLKLTEAPNEGFKVEAKDPHLDRKVRAIGAYLG